MSASGDQTFKVVMKIHATGGILDLPWISFDIIISGTKSKINRNKQIYLN
jgi:hypothetical protein